ncbi:MAG: hypothetical protein GY731_16025, partial [Gammaproteobacteria bacterium]|nr:hypothetical protein [Gammaproteobacteria bacterium]
MSCMCLQSLRRALESLKNLPLKALTGLIPKGLVYSPDLTQLSQQSAAVISARAFASANVSAQINAALKLSLPKVPIGLPKLLALAQISGAGGINMAMGSRLSIMSNSIRLNAPAITPMIAELLDPFMDALMELMALASAISSANTALGVNLMQPGALARLPVSVSLSQGISVNETLKANLGAAAGLGDLGLMMNAASTLGINLGSPGGVAKLAMLIKATAAMPIPKIDIPPELLKLSSAMAALNSVSSASGINLMTSVSLNPLRAALNALMANLD